MRKRQNYEYKHFSVTFKLGVDPPSLASGFQELNNNISEAHLEEYPSSNKSFSSRTRVVGGTSERPEVTKVFPFASAESNRDHRKV